MSSFEIPDGPSAVVLKKATVGGKSVVTGTASFTVNNKAGQPVSCRLKVSPQGNAKTEWFEVQGEPERPFAAAESQKVTVRITAPDTSETGEAKFRFQALNVSDTGNDYAESGVVTLQRDSVAPAKVNWLLIGGIAAAVLLVAIGVATYLWFNRTAELVALTGKTFDEAKSTLMAAGFDVAEPPVVDTTTPNAEPGKVTDQEPKPGRVRVGSTVTLHVAKGIVVPPEIIGKTLGEAKPLLAQFTIQVQPAESIDTDTVVGSTPGADNVPRAIGSTVTLTTDGIDIPELKTLPLNDALAKLRDKGLALKALVQVARGAGGNIVIDQNPAAGHTKKQDVTLTVAIEDRCLATPRPLGCPPAPPFCRTHPHICFSVHDVRELPRLFPHTTPTIPITPTPP